MEYTTCSNTCLTTGRKTRSFASDEIQSLQPAFLVAHSEEQVRNRNVFMVGIKFFYNHGVLIFKETGIRLSSFPSQMHQSCRRPETFKTITLSVNVTSQQRQEALCRLLYRCFFHLNYFCDYVAKKQCCSIPQILQKVDPDKSLKKKPVKRKKPRAKSKVWNLKVLLLRHAWTCETFQTSNAARKRKAPKNKPVTVLDDGKQWRKKWWLTLSYSYFVQWCAPRDRDNILVLVQTMSCMVDQWNN